MNKHQYGNKIKRHSNVFYVNKNSQCFLEDIIVEHAVKLYVICVVKEDK